MYLGKVSPAVAAQFVASNQAASLGSLSGDGLRRVNGPESLRIPFEQVGGITLQSRSQANDINVATSGIGTQIISAIESTADYRIRCGTCRTFLNSLNSTQPPYDADKIVEAILPGIGLPIAIRETVGGTKEQRVWLRAIVSHVIESTRPS